MHSMPVLQNVFNGHVRLPPLESVDMCKIERNLAESWEKNDEATEWTFHLREKFSCIKVRRIYFGRCEIIF